MHRTHIGAAAQNEHMESTEKESDDEMYAVDLWFSSSRFVDYNLVRWKEACQL